MQFYTAKEIAEMLKINPLTVKREYDRGKLNGFYVGNELRVSAQDFDDYTRLKSHQKTSREIELEREIEKLKAELRGKESTINSIKNILLKDN